MDFVAFRQKIKASQPRKWSERQRLLNARDLALDGRLYDHIGSPFTREYKYDQSDERLTLDERRAAVEDRLPLIVARSFANRLFGEGQRPTPFVRDDYVTNAWIMAFIKDTNLWWHLWSAAYQGQSGSVAIVLRVLAKNTFKSGDPKAKQSGPGQYHLEVWPGVECLPVFKPWAPTELETLERQYFVQADTLRARGYDVDALDQKWQTYRYGRTAGGRRLRQLAGANAQGMAVTDWWAMRLRLIPTGELWYEPIPKWLFDSDDFTMAEWPEDATRSFEHGLDETCGIWIPNGPDRDASFPDGICTFEPAINFQFRIDRTLSQAGRAFDYAGDPQVALIEGGKGSTSDGGGSFDGPEVAPGATASDLISVPAGGDAKFLEIRGDGLKVAIDTYVDKLRHIARELCAISRIDPETAGRELSGAAMARLDDAMIGMLGLLKIAYGDRGLEQLLRLGMRLYAKVKVRLPSFEEMLRALLERRDRMQKTQRSTDANDPENPDAPKVTPETAPVIDAAKARPNPDAYIETKWPPVHSLTGAEKQAEVSAAVAARDGKVITQETAVANVASIFDVPNPDQELADIVTESMEAEERELEIAERHAQIKATYTVQAP